MRKLFYMGLEGYEERYTLQLTEWSRKTFEQRGLDVVYVNGKAIDASQKICVGQVLDAHNRSYFAMSQMMALIELMHSGAVTADDVVYFEDMFHPGFEALGYVFNQIPANQMPRVFVHCLAQSIDPDDFIHVTGMNKWMGYYEKMTNDIVSFSRGAVLATNEEMVAHMRIAGWEVPIYNISGLAFGKEEVQQRVGGVDCIKPFDERRRRVAFSARFDQEKQPGFFMDLIDAYKDPSSNRDPRKPCEFAIYSGGAFRSNNSAYVDRARSMEQRGLLRIYDNLKKNDYYALLNDTRVLFNCALQDWTSNTVSEADALGCNVVYPAYRSFPETFANDAERMYVPWSIADALSKVEKNLERLHWRSGLISDWNNQTTNRIVDIMQTAGTADEGSKHCLATTWKRSGKQYRDHVSGCKY